MKIIMPSAEPTKKFMELGNGAVFICLHSGDISPCNVYIKTLPIQKDSGEYNAFSPTFSEMIMVAKEADCIELDATLKIERGTGVC